MKWQGNQATTHLSVPVMYVKPAMSKTQAGPATLYFFFFTKPSLNLVGHKDNEDMLSWPPTFGLSYRWTLLIDRPKILQIKKIQNNVYAIKENTECKLSKFIVFGFRKKIVKKISQFFSNLIKNKIEEKKTKIFLHSCLIR